MFLMTQTKEWPNKDAGRNNCNRRTSFICNVTLVATINDAQNIIIYYLYTIQLLNNPGGTCQLVGNQRYKQNSFLTEYASLSLSK